MKSSLRRSLVLLAAVLALAGCESEQAVQSGPPAATVTTATVASQPWSDTIEALGTARANESLMVTAKVTETVVKVNFEDGDLVEAGDVLVDLSGRVEVAGLAEAAAAYREAEKQYQRQQQLAAQKLIPAGQLDTQRAAMESSRARLDATRARLSDRVITAPFAGVLGFRQVSPGTLVTPGTVIASLDDVSLIKLDFAVPEAFLSAVASGQAITASSAAWPGREFTGVVTTVDSRVDPVTRAVTVRAELPNPERALRPGMLLTVRLFQPERQALVIPEISVIQVAQRAHVFRLKDDGSVEQVYVDLGQRRRGEVEVLDGLSAGDRIVVDGVVKLRDGARVTEAAAPAPAAAAEDTAA
ncbi:MAG TPA: efflux RND transporter periplasmic adaptor subunit [Arenimonas sp.]|uniref:efflux RND transporter periplasmic adaptor subunit n=1 Tax=Arenimonas sp. TaxID=1872635 RepID=UPI002D806866|nr:efflux RND transporter periplasmic adaptor subunit [Arenimonas sp.]HEU0152539.1 efflux RND transporter periplasmic adaptor subunit [Arenimonas sp.]